MGGHADSKAVDCYGAVFVLIDRNIDVAVIEIVVGIVPVSATQVSLFAAAHDDLYSCAYVLSKPIPCVRTCTVGFALMSSSGMQNCVLMLYVPETVW